MDVIACISIPYFAAALERRGDTALNHKPLAIGGQPWESRPVYAFSQEVAHKGVQPGMSLRLVHVLSPQSYFMPATELKYSQTSGEIVDILTDFSRFIEPQELWHPFTKVDQRLTMSGRALPARYCLDLEELPLKESLPFARQIGQTVRRETHLAPAIGLAANKFTAQIAATLGSPNCILPVSPGEEAQFLSTRATDFLPLDKEATRRLRLLGIRTLGQLADLPLDTLMAQFGPSMGPFYNLVQGRDDGALQSLPAERHEEVRRLFEEPLANMLDLTIVLGRMAVELVDRLQTAALEGRELCLVCETEDGERQRCQMTLRRPTADSQHLSDAVQELIARLSFSSGISSLTVGMADLTPATTCQLTLFPEAEASGAEVSHRVRQTVGNLAAKYGASLFSQPTLTEPHHPLPERRFQLQPFGQAAPGS
jgi:DNA polymerase-4